MSAARYALLRLEEGPPHVKNWRPQLLILLKTGENMEPKYRKLLTFSSQLKAGKGLTLVASVLEGDHHERRPDAEIAKHNLTEMMKRERVKGFAEVIVSRNVGDGVSYLIQGAGVGGLRHNSLLMNWPHKWRKDKGYQSFIDIMKIAADRQLAVLIIKGINQFPENGDRLGGTIDIWWIVHEGGLLMLLPFLLTQGKVWRKCKLRIFTVAQMEDNSIQIKKDMEKFLYHLRIPAQVKVVEMPTSDISAYTYERTLMMEQRNALLEKMHIKRSSLAPQMIVDQAHAHHVYHLSPRHQQTHQPQRSQPETLLHSEDVAIDMNRIEMNKAEVSAETTQTKKIEEMDEVEVIKEDDEMNKEEENPGNAEKPDQELAEGVKETEMEREDAEGEDTVEQLEDHVTTEHGHDAAKKEADEAVRNDIRISEGSSAGEKVTPPPNYNSLGAKLTPSAQKPRGLQEKQETSNVQMPNSQNVRRMHTAIRLNQVIKEESIDAKLVIINLPGPPRDNSGEENYMDFLEALTEGLERVVMVRGGGKEVITIYS